MKEIDQIAESNKVVGQKRRKRRRGLRFSGTKQLRRSAMRTTTKKKESVSTNKEMMTPEQDRGSVLHTDVSPFRLRHLPRSISLQAVSERDEDERVLLSPESRERVWRDTQSKADSLDFDKDNDDNDQDDGPTVRFFTIVFYHIVNLSWNTFLTMFMWYSKCKGEDEQTGESPPPPEDSEDNIEEDSDEENKEMQDAQEEDFEDGDDDEADPDTPNVSKTNLCSS